MSFDPLIKVRKDSDQAITMVPDGLSFEMQPENLVLASAGRTEDPSITTAAHPVIPMYITVPGFTRKNITSINAFIGKGTDLTFMLLINPETLNCGKTGNTQYNYTRKGFVTQLWGLNLDTLTANGKTAAFFVSGDGLTNNLRSYSVGFLNFMALVNAFKNNGYRLVDRTLLNTLEMATRVIDVVNGVKISYDGNVIMGHFNNFTLDEDAEHPYLLTYNFEFVVSAYGTSSSPSGSGLSHNGMNEIYGHYLQTEDDISFEVKYYSIRLLSDFDNYFSNAAIVEPQPSANSKDLRALWELKTGLPWNEAVAHGWDKDLSFLYYSLINPDALETLMNDLKGVPLAQPTFKSIASVNKIMNSDIPGTSTTLLDATNDTIDDIKSKGYVFYAGKKVMLSAQALEALDSAMVFGGLVNESSGNPSSMSDIKNKKGVVVNHAYGYMQITPGTGRDLGIPDISKATPLENLQAGIAYQAYLLDLYDGDKTLAYAAYNSGPGNVNKAGRKVPLIPETQVYVVRCMKTNSQVANKDVYKNETPHEVAKESSQSSATQELINNVMNPLNKYFPPMKVQ